MNYWEECISSAFDEAGITATEEQIKMVAEDVEGARETYLGMAIGRHHGPDPLQVENDKLKKELQREKDKAICEKCNGSGVRYGDRCYQCDGKGRR